MRTLCLLLAVCLLAGCSNTTGTSLPSESNNAAPEVQLVMLDIYAVNDLHGKLADTQFQPGVDELSTYLKQAQQSGNTILLSTGDMWQGAYESNLTGGFAVTEWMNELDFAAMTLGGHEYDWGEAQIRQNQQLAEFPFLAINIYSRETDQQADYCQSSLVVEVEGAQIGIIGAIGNCYYSISADKTQDVYFKTGEELTALVKAEAEKLRSQGVDFIIYAIHDGYDKATPSNAPVAVDDQALMGYYDTSLSDGYVDLVFEADTHYTYTLTDRFGVYHMQAGGNNSGISHASVLIDLAAGSSTVYHTDLLTPGKYKTLEDDPVVTQLLDKYSEQIAAGTQILGTNSRYRSGSDICQMVADAYCAAGLKKWGADYDIVLGGGYISCRSPGYMPTGQVTYGQVLSLLPFDNEITLCSILGRDLIDTFLETDHFAYYIATTSYGESVRNAIDPNGIYYVVTDSYSAYYAYNNMTVVDTYDQDIFARDLVAAYIAGNDLPN